MLGNETRIQDTMRKGEDSDIKIDLVKEAMAAIAHEFDDKDVSGSVFKYLIRSKKGEGGGWVILLSSFLAEDVRELIPAIPDSRRRVSNLIDAAQEARGTLNPKYDKSSIERVDYYIGELQQVLAQCTEE